MSLKAKLTSLIMAVVLLLGLIVVGVFAATKPNFKVGGNVKFNVDNVITKIELLSLNDGTLINGIAGVDKFQTFELNNETSKQDAIETLSTWTGIGLAFSENDGTPMTMQIKITNMAPAGADNYIDLSVDVDEGENDNCTIKAENQKGFQCDLISPQESSTYTITFDASDPLFKASLTGFQINFNLEKKTLAEIPTGMTGLLFDYVDSNKKDSLSVNWDKATTLAEELEIPAFVNYNDSILPVTKLVDYAFYQNSVITNVSLPSTVSIMGTDSFRACTKLKNILLSENIESIPNNAFYQSTALEKIDIPSSVISINNYAFYQCSGLQNMTLHEGLESINEGAFYSCYNLQNFKMPNSLKTIGNNAFYNCLGLTSITIPENVESIVYSFNTCKNLQSVIINSKNLTLGEYAFSACTSLSNLKISKGLKSIGQRAFSTCSSLQRVDLPDGLTSIDTYAFNKCSNLVTVTIPDSVTTIGGWAFNYCSKLEKVKIPSGVTTISERAFTYCSSLSSVIIPEGVTAIETYAFYPCAMDTVRIPSSVTSIGAAAFSITNLNTVIIDSYPIAYQLSGDGSSICGGILINAKTVKVPTSIVGSLNTYVKNNFTHTSTETIDGVEYTVYDKYLKSVTGLTFSYVNESTKDALQVAWDGTTTFTQAVKIPDYLNYNGTVLRVTTIAVSAFEECSSLTSVTIPNTVTTIGVSGFRKCTNLPSITIPSSVTSIGAYIFFGCENLENITIEAGGVYDSRNNCNAVILTATNRLIAGCKNTVIPEGVESIANSAFEACYTLESITIPASVTSIGAYAFSQCNSLTTLIVNSETIASALKGVNPDTDCGKILAYVKTVKVLTSIVTAGKLNSYVTTNYYNMGTEGDYTIYQSSALIPTSVTGLTFSYVNESTKDALQVAWDGTTTFTEPVEIPAYLNYNGTVLPVTKIKGSAFSECESLESIIIPEGVTSIGDDAFYECTSLTSIVIPNSVTSIEEIAFFDCVGITSIVIPSSVTSIGDSAFIDCTGLTTIIVESETIASALSGTDTSVCGGILAYAATVKVLTSIVDAGKLNSYVTTSFQLSGTEGNYNVYTKINYPSSVTGLTFSYVDENTKDALQVAWDGTTTFTNTVEIPAYLNYNGTVLPVTSVGDNAFLLCASLESIIISEGVKSIGTDVFDNCTSLKSVTIPNSVTSIGDSAFYGCTSLESITIPSSMTSIGNCVFEGCTSLESITIPSSVTSIGYGVFDDCTSLTDIYYTGTEQQWALITIEDKDDFYDPLENITIHYNYGATEE